MFLILSLPLSPLCYSRFWLLFPSELTFAPSLGLIVNYHRMLSRSCVIYSLTLFIHLHYPCSRILQYRIFSVLFFIISNINYVPVLSVLCNGSSCVIFFLYYECSKVEIFLQFPYLFFLWVILSRRYFYLCYHYHIPVVSLSIFITEALNLVYVLCYGLW